MSMYLDHFGLREAPFCITPHTDFFFSGANRGATLEALVYAVSHDEGIVRVTGEVGSGKTMLCRMLLEKLPATVETVYLANPSLSRDELLYAVADEIRMPAPPERIHQFLRSLQQHLVDLYAEGKQVVVLIDEAHAMPKESLEEIRLLSNLESNRHKLLKIVLFGQPELDGILSQQDMRQLRERITQNFELEPLLRTDVGTYLMFRMRAAGYRGPDIFSPGAIRLFAKASGGLTRRLNILGDKALLAAFAGNHHQVGDREAKAAIRDAKFEDIKPRSVERPKTFALWLGMATGVLATVAFLNVPKWFADPPRSKDDETSPAKAVSRSTETALPAGITSAVAAPVLSSVEVVASPAAVSPPVVERDAAMRLSSVDEASVVRQDVNPPPVEVVSAVEELSPVEDDVASGSVAQSTSTTAGASLLEEHSAQFRTWIAEVGEGRYAIQLISAPVRNGGDIEHFLRLARRVVPSENLRVYSTINSGQEWLGLLYGDFSSFTEAEKNLERLPERLRSQRAFVRSIKQLKP